MQVIEMRMRDEHEIDRWQISNAQPRTTEPLQHKQPPREIGINQNTFSPNLYEEACVSDEGDAEFSVGGETRLVSLTGARSHC